MERTAGFEPVISAWRAEVLPLHYIRVGAFEEIRTLDPRLRRPLLYPAELRGLKSSRKGALGNEKCLNHDRTKK